MSPQEFKRLTPDEQEQVLRLQTFDREKRIMEQLHSSLTLRSENGYDVYSPLEHITEPIANFSHYKYAELLSKWVKSTRGPIALNEGAVSVVEIDKYLEPMKTGKKPYNVSLWKDGSVFLLEPYFELTMIYEPRVSKNESWQNNEMVIDQRAGMSGTFWAYDQTQAIEAAQQYLAVLMERGEMQIDPQFLAEIGH